MLHLLTAGIAGCNRHVRRGRQLSHHRLRTRRAESRVLDHQRVSPSPLPH